MNKQAWEKLAEVVEDLNALSEGLSPEASKRLQAAVVRLCRLLDDYPASGHGQAR